MRAKAGCAARARSRNRRPAPEASSAAAAGAASGSGRPREGTRQAVSPATPSSSRLVASTRTPGQPRSDGVRQAGGRPPGRARSCPAAAGPARGAGAPPARASGAAGAPGRPRPGAPTAARAAAGTSAPAASGARSTNQTPSGYPSMASAAACRARRVLPVPPVPVRVSSRVVARSRATSASSRSRPTKLVTCRGRLWGSASRVRRAGKSAGEARGGQLEHPLRALEVLEPVLPQVEQPRPRRQRVPHQAAAASESTTCPPWAVPMQPGAAVQRRPRSSGAALALHLPRVQPHPGPEGPRPARPVRRLQGQLPGQGRRGHGVGGAGEGGVARRPPPSRTPPPRAPPPPPAGGRGAGARRRR